MNLQSVKNYLIFLVAVSHMLYSGYHVDEKTSKEGSDAKPLRNVATALKASDSTQIEVSAAQFIQTAHAGKAKKSVRQEQQLRKSLPEDKHPASGNEIPGFPMPNSDEQISPSK